MPKLSVLFLGPAGSGKTLLTWAFGKWLENSGFTVDYVNLDPAVEFLPYTPSLHARSIVKTRDVMVREGLGPNAAIVRAVDILAESYREVYEALSVLKGDYILVDTPGQMEIVIFRPSGLKLIQVVKKASEPVGVFLLDSTLGRYGAGAAVSVLLGIVAQLRLEIPIVPVLSKADASGTPGGLVSHSIHLEVEEIVSNLSRSGSGVLSEMLSEVLDLVKRYLKAGRLIAVSSIEGYGIDELYKMLHEVFCACGDLT